jgi:hypothetical protein
MNIEEARRLFWLKNKYHQLTGVQVITKDVMR